MTPFKTLVAGLAVAALVLPAAADEPPVEIIGATVNFGQVTQQKIVVHDFFIKASGGQQLKITTMFSGCGCTEIPLGDSIVPANDSLPLRIEFSTGNFRGLVVKSPTIRTDLTGDLPLKMDILAEVLPDGDSAWPVVLQPEMVDVSQFGQEERRRASFFMVNRSDENLKVTPVDTALLAFQVKVPDVIKAGEKVEGRLRVREDKIEEKFTESVTFKLDGRETYFVTLPVERFYRE